MTSDLPPPLVPPDCDLRDFQYMPLDVHRLLTSETWVLGTGDERAAAMTLWLESWHQVPAGSIPKDDRMLAHLSQAGTKWTKVKAHVMRGWVACNDGRLYHPVVAEKALEAWIEKLTNSLSGSAGNAKRWGVAIETDSIRLRAVVAIETLRQLAPQSKTLKKKAVAMIDAGSQPDSGGDKKASGGDNGGGSGCDSGGDRNNKGLNIKGLNILSGKPDDTLPGFVDSPAKKQKQKPKQADIGEVLSYLNEKTGFQYGETKSNVGFVSARLEDGATVEQCKAVIDAKVKEWGNDPNWRKYLRPQTLFNETKFSSYVAQLNGNCPTAPADPEAWRNLPQFRGAK